MENNEISSSLSHKIVHLNSRPTQLYYEGVPPLLNNISVTILIYFKFIDYK